MLTYHYGSDNSAFEFKNGGYVPGDIIAGNNIIDGLLVPRRRFPFEFELMKKMGLHLRSLPEEEFLTRDGYIRYAMDDWDRKVIEDGEPVVEYVKWTDEEADVINAVWHLINDKCKVR